MSRGPATLSYRRRSVTARRLVSTMARCSLFSPPPRRPGDGYHKHHKRSVHARQPTREARDGHRSIAPDLSCIGSLIIWQRCCPCGAYLTMLGYGVWSRQTRVFCSSLAAADNQLPQAPSPAWVKGGAGDGERRCRSNFRIFFPRRLMGWRG